MNEQEKKRVYNERVLQIESSTITILVFQFMEVWGGNAVRFFQDYPIYCQINVIYQNRSP